MKDLRATERRLSRTSTDEDIRSVRQLRARAARIVAIDFFNASGRDEVERAVAELEDHIRREPTLLPQPGQAPLDPARYQQRTWLTRPHPGVDRSRRPG